MKESLLWTAAGRHDYHPLVRPGLTANPGDAVVEGIMVPGVYVLIATVATPFCQFFLSDPGRPVVPVLPAVAVPRIGGGWLPNPPPPSEQYLLAQAAAAGRRPGDLIVSRQVASAQFGAARQYPGVGKGRLWLLQYRCEAFGPDGPYTIYVDRAAIVLVP